MRVVLVNEKMRQGQANLGRVFNLSCVFMTVVAVSICTTCLVAYTSCELLNEKERTIASDMIEKLSKETRNPEKVLNAMLERVRLEQAILGHYSHYGDDYSPFGQQDHNQEHSTPPAKESEISSSKSEGGDKVGPDDGQKHALASPSETPKDSVSPQSVGQDGGDQHTGTSSSPDPNVNKPEVVENKMETTSISPDGRSLRRTSSFSSVSSSSSSSESVASASASSTAGTLDHHDDKDNPDDHDSMFGNLFDEEFNGQHGYTRLSPMSNSETPTTENPLEDHFEETYLDESDPNDPKVVHVKKQAKSVSGPDGTSEQVHHSQTSTSLGGNKNSYKSSTSSYNSSTKSNSIPGSKKKNTRSAKRNIKRRRAKARARGIALPYVPLSPMAVMPYAAWPQVSHFGYAHMPYDVQHGAATGSHNFKPGMSNKKAKKLQRKMQKITSQWSDLE